MKAIPKHFSLVNEHPFSYEIHDARDNKRFHIAKHELDLAMHSKLSKIKKFDEGGTVNNASDSSDNDSQSPVTVNVNTPGLGANTNLADIATPQVPPLQAAPVGSAPVPLSIPPNAQMPANAAPVAVPGFNPRAPLVQQASGAESLGERGIRGEMGVGAAQSNADAAALKAVNDQRVALFNADQASRAKLLQEQDQLFNAVANEKIDPNHYWGSKSTGQKIMNSAGIMLGAISQGFSGSNVNPAMQNIQKNIDRDIDAQKENLGIKKTLYSMNLEKFKNQDAATAATSNQMNAIVDGLIKQNAVSAGGQKAGFLADQLIADRRTKYLQALPDLSVQQLKVEAANERMGLPPTPSAAQQVVAPIDPNRGPQGGGISAIPNASVDQQQKNAADQTFNSEPSAADQALFDRSNRERAMAGLPPLRPGSFQNPGNGAPTQDEAPEGPPSIGLTPESINLRKLQRDKLVGFLPTADAEAATKEAGAIQENYAAKQIIKNDFDRMIHAMNTDNGGGVALRRAQEVIGALPFGIGAPVQEMNPWGGKSGREFARAKADFLNHLTAALTRRVGGDAMKNIKITAPSGEEGLDELYDQLKMAYDTLDKHTDTTILSQGYLKGAK